MPSIKCPIATCTYSTEDVDATVAAVLLTIHNNEHLAVATPRNSDTAVPQRAPKIDRPKISAGSSEEM